MLGILIIIVKCYGVVVTWSKLLSIDMSSRFITRSSKWGKHRSRSVERMGKNSVASDKAD